MLEEQPWLKLSEGMADEWRQAWDEGFDCACLKGGAAAASESAAAAAAYREVLYSCPVQADYAYAEPDGLEKIRALRARLETPLPAFLPEGLEEKLRGAWLGRIAGCLLGKPIEGWRTPRINALLKATGNYPLSRYISLSGLSEGQKDEFNCHSGCFADSVGGIAPADDDTNYTVLSLLLCEKYGPGFRSEDVLEAWLERLPMFSCCTAERIAYRNAANGLLPPETAKFANPYREWIGAQIRGDFFGYICPGEPERAAELAWRDARVSHVKNGIYGEMFAAALVAASAVCGNTRSALEAAVGEIPRTSRLHEAICKIFALRDSRGAAEDAFALVHGMFDENDGFDWCHTVPNAMLVASALLWGEGDFGKSVCLAVSPGFDTDCNGATVGSALGFMLGARGIPEEWTAPFAGGLETTVIGMQKAGVGALVRRTAEVYKRFKAE